MQLDRLNPDVPFRYLITYYGRVNIQQLLFAAGLCYSPLRFLTTRKGRHELYHRRTHTGPGTDPGRLPHPAHQFSTPDVLAVGRKTDLLPAHARHPDPQPGRQADRLPPIAEGPVDRGG